MTDGVIEFPVFQLAYMSTDYAGTWYTANFVEGEDAYRSGNTTWYVTLGDDGKPINPFKIDFNASAVASVKAKAKKTILPRN